ncbi:MAG TPA: right-handed parallel beta-helix repeat-containing protein [Pyrinomonadaceae bacterium]|jgi:parallel beta-helix repeat protein|nr:right-handed parallel beta-helix repeat-containing protein [Pyrinomonadaceae bacterium]
MNNLPRQKLLEIIRRHGHEIIDAPRRCEGLMRDNFPAHRREIAVLTSALEERIPAELLAARTSRTPQGVLLARLTARLHDEVAMEASAARWTVHTWAFALGVITTDELDALEQADKQANEQANEQAARTTRQPSQPSRSQPSHAAQADAGAYTSPPAASPSASASPSARMSFVVALDGSGDFLSLTDAVRRAPANSLLLVRPGIYNEGLLIDKSLEIIGDGALGEIILRATTSSCLVMRTDAAIIRNLTLRGQSRAGGANDEGFFAVDIMHGRPLFEACDISSDSLASIAIHNPTAAPLIRNCRIHHGVDSGVYAFDGAQGLIEACDISENSNIGIAITSGANTNVRGCHIHDGADAGIVVWNRATTTVEGCDIYANRRANVGISDASVATLRGCRIHDGDNTGIFAHRDGRATVEACNIYAHAEAEVAVTSGGEVRLHKCQIHDGQSHGVFAQDAGRALLETCDVFRNRESGVHVDANGAVIAHACRINDNGHVAVSCEAGGAVEVVGCDLTQNRVATWQTDYGSRVVSSNNRL